MSNKFTTYRIVKIILLIFFTIFLSFSVISIADVGLIDFRKHERDYKEDEILVKFREATSDYSIMSTIEVLGGETIKKAGTPDYHLVKLGPGKEVEEAIAEYQKMPNVEYAQLNYIYKTLSTVPNDTYYPQLWGLKNTEQTINNPTYNKNNPGVSGMDMDLELAWDHVTDCSSIVIAVIDTGVSYDHVDLAGNMWDGAVNHGYDFVDDDDDPIDLNGHGTHVAGTIGAIGNNDTGTAGVCWGVKIMAVRVFNAVGKSTTADIISGVYYAVDNGAQVLNMSFGQKNYDQAKYNALEYARNNNVIAITSAGNDGLDNDTDSHNYPSDFDLDNIICVTALDQSYELADFSNFGSTSADVGAPGTNILSEFCGAETMLTPSLASGWSEGGTSGWDYGTVDLGYGNMDCLQDPWNWGPPSWGFYSSNAQDTIWRTFNLSGNDVAVLRYLILHDLENNYDSFYCVCDDVAGDPFFNPNVLAVWTGSTEGYFYLDEWIIPDLYLTPNCTIGFGLWSDSVVQEYGVAITAVSISAISLNNNSFKVQQGTSMATPHVSGLAALIWVFNPEYTYTEVIESIKNGGESVGSLSGKTVSGKAVNAWGSLNYIKPPSGITVTFELKDDNDNGNGDDVDDISPQIIASELSNDNSYVDVVFSEGVYSTSYGSGALESSDFSISFAQNGGTATGAFIGSLNSTSGSTLNGGESVIRMHLNIDGTPSGVETVEITPAGENSIYDYSGNPAIETETTGQLTLNEENGSQIEIGLITITDPTETVNQSADIPTYVVSAYAEDTEGNPVIDGTQIYWRDLNQNASPQAAATGTTNGVAMVTFDLDTLAGTQYIFQADDDGNFLEGVNDASPTMTTIAGVPASLVLSSGAEVNMNADLHSLDVTATVRDGSTSTNLVVDGTEVDWTLTNGVAPWSLSSSSTTTVGGQTMITVTTGTSTTVNATDTMSGTALGGSNPNDHTIITVIEGALEDFGIGAISTPQEVGVPFNLVMTARDQYTNTVTGFDGIVEISDSTETITPVTSEAFSVGTRTESVTIMLAQADVQISVVETVSSKIGISNLFDINSLVISFTDSGQELGDTSGLGIDLVDLDGDADLDAFVSTSDQNKVWINNGSGVFSDSGQSLGDSYSHNADLGDLDGDGDMDAFIANYIDQPNKVWLNNGSGVFLDSSQSLGDSSSKDVDLGDFDGDGDLDAFVANPDSAVWLNNGSGSFTDSGQSLGNSNSWSVECTDVDNDGDLDAIVANSGSNEVWLNNGSGNFTNSNQSLGDSISLGVNVGDLDGGGDIDAYFSNRSQPNKVWLNNGSGTYTDSGQNLGSSHSYCIELGDFDGDGDLDAFVANYQDQPNIVWVNDGNGAFTDNGQTLGNSSSVGVDLGDVDGDGDVDAFTANHFSQPDKVWLNE